MSELVSSGRWGAHRVEAEEFTGETRYRCFNCGLEFVVRTDREEDLRRAAAKAPTIFRRMACRQVSTGIEGKNAAIPAGLVPLGTHRIGGRCA